MQQLNIILTGFMGTGKTTVGKMLAQQLDFNFVDTDELIQERVGKTIPEIFEDLGEDAFRKMEADLAMELAQSRQLVISTGGRLMLDPDNAAALSRTGRVFCLVASAEEIFERVSKDDVITRPLLSTSNAMERIVELMGQRQDAYRQFTEIVTSGKTPQMVTKHLLDILK
jgi:shikimate kinase